MVFHASLFLGVFSVGGLAEESDGLLQATALKATVSLHNPGGGVMSSCPQECWNTRGGGLCKGDNVCVSATGWCGEGEAYCRSGIAHCGGCSANACNGQGEGCAELAYGDGDCDKDADCAPGLMCGRNNCKQFRSDEELSGFASVRGDGWDEDDDCCFQPQIIEVVSIIHQNKYCADNPDGHQDVVKRVGGGDSVEDCAKAVAADDECGPIFHSNREAGGAFPNSCSCVRPGERCVLLPSDSGTSVYSTLLGKPGSNACPAGHVRLSTKQECDEVASDLGLQIKSEQSSGYPGGCLLRRDVRNTAGIAVWNPMDGGEQWSASTICKKAPEDVSRITCPFLSTLFHENVLPHRPVYTDDELVDLVLAAGLSRKDAFPHIESQVRRVGVRQFDIFNMEGFPNEHQTSTGITDCKSSFLYDDDKICTVSQNSSDPFVGVKVCKTEKCNLPNEGKFEDFFNDFDLDGNGWLNEQELNEANLKYDKSGNSVDTQKDPDVEGKIGGATNFMIQIFGRREVVGGQVQPATKMLKRDLRLLYVNRRFPKEFLPEDFGVNACDGKQHSLSVPRLFSDGSTGQFGIRNTQTGAWLTVTSGSAGDSVIMSIDHKHQHHSRPAGSMWTAKLNEDQFWQFRSSVNGKLLDFNADGMLSDSDRVGHPSALWLLDPQDVKSSKMRSANGDLISEHLSFAANGDQFEFVVCDLLAASKESEKVFAGRVIDILNKEFLVD